MEKEGKCERAGAGCAVRGALGPCAERDPRLPWFAFGGEPLTRRLVVPPVQRMGVVVAQNRPTRVSLPRTHYRVGQHIVLFEFCSAFTHVAACTLARSPNS